MYDHMRAVTHHTPASDLNDTARNIRKAAKGTSGAKPKEIYDLVSAYLFDKKAVMKVNPKKDTEAKEFAPLDQDTKPPTPRVHPWKEELDNTMFYI
jgi:hypothetical protein